MKYYNKLILRLKSPYKSLKAAPLLSKLKGTLAYLFLD